MKPSLKNADEYLAALPDEQRIALQKLRKLILAAAPDCEEYFGYGMPGFKLNGHAMLYMGAAKNHCALYGGIPKGFDVELKDFKRSKGTVQFTPENPIPAPVVKAIVKAKVAEMNAKWPVKTEAKTKNKARRRNE